EAGCREATAARRSDAVYGLHVNILNQLIEELAERARRMQREREHARQWTEAECLHEDEREDEGRDGAQELQQPARSTSEPRACGQVCARDETEHETYRAPEQCPDIGHNDRLEQEREPVREVPKPTVVTERMTPDPLAAIEQEAAIEVIEQIPSVRPKERRI